MGQSHPSKVVLAKNKGSHTRWRSREVGGQEDMGAGHQRLAPAASTIPEGEYSGSQDREFSRCPAKLVVETDLRRIEIGASWPARCPATGHALFVLAMSRAGKILVPADKMA